MSDDEDDDVGYRRPPKRYQFKKGQSGNPSGRRKGLGLEGVFERVLKKRVSLSIDGKRQSVSLLEAIVLRQAQAASQGNMTAARDIQNIALKLDIIQQEAATDVRQMPMQPLVFVGVRPKPRPEDDGVAS